MGKQEFVPLKDRLADAVRNYLHGRTGNSSKSTLSAPAPPLSPRPAWMSAFGGLRSLHKETHKIIRVLAEEFERVEEDEWL